MGDRRMGGIRAGWWIELAAIAVIALSAISYSLLRGFRNNLANLG